jgi:penicillin-binding protein 1A
MGFMPSFEDLENPQNNLASLVFSADGEMLGQYYDQNRTYAEFDELSENIVNALLATEDIRFHSHPELMRGDWHGYFVKSIVLRQETPAAAAPSHSSLPRTFFRVIPPFTGSIAASHEPGYNQIQGVGDGRKAGKELHQG